MFKHHHWGLRDGSPGRVYTSPCVKPLVTAPCSQGAPCKREAAESVEEGCVSHLSPSFSLPISHSISGLKGKKSRGISQGQGLRSLRAKKQDLTVVSAIPLCPLCSTLPVLLLEYDWIELRPKFKPLGQSFHSSSFRERQRGWERQREWGKHHSTAICPSCHGCWT